MVLSKHPISVSSMTSRRTARMWPIAAMVLALTLLAGCVSSAPPPSPSSTAPSSSTLPPDGGLSENAGSWKNLAIQPSPDPRYGAQLLADPTSDGLLLGRNGSHRRGGRTDWRSLGPRPGRSGMARPHACRSPRLPESGCRPGPRKHPDDFPGARGKFDSGRSKSRHEDVRMASRREELAPDQHAAVSLISHRWLLYGVLGA